MADSIIGEFLNTVGDAITSVVTGIPILQFALNLIPIVLIVAFFLFILVLVARWLGVEMKFFSGLVKHPTIFTVLILLIIIIMLIANSGGLDFIMGRTNYTGELGVPTENLTAEDLANPMVTLAQPQIAGTLLILTVFAMVTFMVTHVKKK